MRVAAYNKEKICILAAKETRERHMFMRIHAHYVQQTLCTKQGLILSFI